MTPEEFADWLDTEARRLKIAREKAWGGTMRRFDLITWADALQWAARKAREKMEHHEQSERPDNCG